ncbi:hypothetical protein [Candidatus Palauibacter sp.]|uniref:hypothetical protein n=1 Tax=Candidatus Palauibacter sp. TaxID=3101350 RepID=UPI003B518479
MPANIAVHGGALSPRGDGSLFWSSDTVWIASPEHPEVRRICPEMVRAPFGAAFMGDGSSTEAPVVEIVDGGVEGRIGPRLIRFSNGACRAESWNGPEPSRPLTRVGGRWVFIDETDPGPPSGVPTIRVSLLMADRHTVDATTIELKTSSSDSIPVVLSGTSRGIVVSSRFFPFAWSASIEPGLNAVAGQIPADNELFYAYDSWVGTGVFALDSGFLQILADLGSDRRHLLIYDTSGAFKRRRVIDVPFGVLDTVPDRQELLALRRTDRLEILTYRWSWQSDRAMDQPEPKE